MRTKCKGELWYEEIKAITLPEPLQYQEFRDAWDELLLIRSSLKSEYWWTSTWVNSLLKRLAFVAEYNREWPVERVENCALKGWIGLIFPDDQEYFKSLKRTGVKLAEKERMQKQYAEPPADKMVKFNTTDLFKQINK